MRKKILTNSLTPPHMQTITTIKQRFSCRNFSSKKIDKKLLVELLELANQAPSACNRQNRHFLVIEKQADRDFLADMNKQAHFAQAPVSIIVLSKKEQFKSADHYLKIMEQCKMTSWGATSHEFQNNQKFLQEYSKMTRNLFPVSDAAAATTTLLLAAHDQGLNSCWVGVHDDEAIKSRFKIPEDYFVVACIVLGYAQEKPNWRAPRKEVGKLISWDKWNNSDS